MKKLEKIYKTQIDDLLKDLSKKCHYKIIVNENFFFNFDDYIFFSYNTYEFLVENNISHALVGNKPILIDKVTKIIYKLYLPIDADFDRTNIHIKDLLDKGWLEQYEYE